MVIVAGISKAKKQVVIISADIIPSLNVISYLFLDDLGLENNIRIKRIQGDNFFLMACGKSLVVIELKNFKL
jgi:hypothetical protein